MNQAEDPGAFKMRVRAVAWFMCLFCLPDTPSLLQIAKIPRQDPTLEIEIGTGQRGVAFGRRVAREAGAERGARAPLLELRCEGAVLAGRRLQLEAVETSFIFR